MNPFRPVLPLLFCFMLGQAHATPTSTLPTYCNSAPLIDQDRLLGAKSRESPASMPSASARLVNDFYAPCAYSPAWILHGIVTTSALQMVQAFKSVAERGLDPGDYPSSMTIPEGTMNMAPESIAEFARFELQLSIGAILLAKDLRCGRIDPHILHADLPENCAVFQWNEFAWNVSRSSDPAVQFDSLEPSAPGYLRTRNALRQYLLLGHTKQPTLLPLRATIRPGQTSDNIIAVRTILLETGDLTPNDDSHTAVYDDPLVKSIRSFQAHHGLPSDGLLTAETYKQLAVPMQDRFAQLGLTLERWRWIQRSFPEPPIVVNIPEFRVRAYDRDLRVALSMKVIVGGAYHRKTPVFENQISSVIFRPYWNVPPGIQHNEIEPAMRRDAGYLQKHGYEIVHGPGNNTRIRQRPGDQNALGLIKFSLPNVHDVYLHGTPAQSLFEKTRRDFSHGCIRLEDPEALAEWVLRLNSGWTRQRIETAMHGSESLSVSVAHPIPVLIVYATAFAAEDSAVYFLPDIYQEDVELLSALRKVGLQHREELNAIVRGIQQ